MSSAFAEEGPARSQAQAVFAVDSTAHAGAANRIAVTPDELTFVTVGSDKTLRLWDVASGRLLRRWVVPVASVFDGELAGLAMSPDGRQVAVGGDLRAFGNKNSVLILPINLLKKIY